MKDYLLMTLNLTLRVICRSALNFFILLGLEIFFLLGFEKVKNFIFRFVVMSEVKVNSRNRLEVKSVTVTEYVVEDDMEKNNSVKSYRGYERLSFGDLDFELDLKTDLATDSAS